MIMISGSVGGTGLDDLMRYLEKFKNPDLVPLGQDIAKALEEGNREGLLAGLDADGNPMADLEDSTLERRLRREGGMGPPTIPRFSASGLIDRFRVEVAPKAGDGIRIRAGWAGVPQVRYFKTGTRHMVARNPVGIRPATREKINELVAALKRKLVARY
jgi:hypothetical protein